MIFVQHIKVKTRHEFSSGFVGRFATTISKAKKNFAERESQYQRIQKLQKERIQKLQIEFVQDKCDVLNSYKNGDNVIIGVNLRGRE